MQRSRFYRIRRMHIPAALVCAAAYWTPAAMASGPLETIFSAENALYGAGYDIGRADGWIDDTLRRAIRQYQADTGELTVSGNLDAPTLDALGIRARSPGVITGNAVSRQDQALAALNLQSPESSRPAARPVARSEPAPERAPEPAPQSTPEPAPEPIVTAKPTPAPQVATAPRAEPALEAVPAEKPVIAETDIRKKEKKTEEQSVVISISTEPEVADAEVPESVEIKNVETESAETESTEAENTETEPATTERVAASSAPSTDESTTEETELVAGLPAEPTAADPAPVKTHTEQQQPRVESGGGFFSSLFDFLFGWLV